ncbi:hypothetical protein D1007_35728 [Hordeum vulgare]|nr:hypothetical protein D1007_35728 [Hordeum vulgare]
MKLELRALVKRHDRIFAEESIVFESLKVPPADYTSAPSLVLLLASKKYISYELVDIQEAPREWPLNKEQVIEMIASEIGPWKSRCGRRTPPDLEVVIGHLQAMVARLRGYDGLEVRREKISQQMKLLQDFVPGCN